MMDMPTDKPFNGYDSGTDAWRDYVMSYGIDEAVVISGRYLELQLKYEQSENEKQHCRELFAAMYEDMAGRVIPSRLVYPYGFETANDRWETSYFHKNQGFNRECSHAIDEAINSSNYKTYHYNLEFAAMSVIGVHGFERVNAVLAHQIQRHESDGRYSRVNKEWARNFNIPDKTHIFLRSHATLIEDFTIYARKLYDNIGAERFALLGNEEHGGFESVHGYGIIRSMMINDHEGYVIAHNPDGCDEFVCWKLAVSGEGERRYDWGLYGSEQSAIDGYNARLFVAFN